MKLEQYCLESLILAITAALETPEKKLIILNSLRIHTELLKQLVRAEHDLGIIQTKTYFHAQRQLQEISKMVNGWFKYIKEKTR